MSRPLDSWLEEFKEVVHGGVAKALGTEGRAQGYEGDIRLEVSIPGYLDRLAPTVYRLELDCYVFGPSRRCKWGGADPDDVFSRALADVRRWIQQTEEEG